jgi:hypothetical protein
MHPECLATRSGSTMSKIRSIATAPVSSTGRSWWRYTFLVTRTRVATQIGDVLDADPITRQHRHEAVTQLASVHAAGSRPAFLVTARNARRTLAAFSALPVALAKTSPSSCQAEPTCLRPLS